MTDVFVCYSRKDQDFVQNLHEALELRNRDTWVDYEDIPATAAWVDHAYLGIEGCYAFVFVISPESIASQFCRQELFYAVEHNKRIVPIVRREVGVECIPPPLENYNWIFFRENDNFEMALQCLTQRVT
jgi:hypothetical protein